MLEFESYDLKPVDIGTRYLHYRQLMDLWEDAIVMLERQNTYSPNKSIRDNINNIEISLEVLKTQIDVMCQFKAYDYKTKYKIDNCRTTEEGGRGTALKEQYNDEDEDGGVLV